MARHGDFIIEKPCSCSTAPSRRLKSHHIITLLTSYYTIIRKKPKIKAAFNIIYHDFEMWEKIQTKTIVWIKLSP